MSEWRVILNGCESDPVSEVRPVVDLRRLDRTDLSNEVQRLSRERVWLAVSPRERSRVPRSPKACCSKRLDGPEGWRVNSPRWPKGRGEYLVREED